MNLQLTNMEEHEPLLLGTLSNGSPISPAILRAHSASLRVFARARNGHASLFEIGIGTADWIIQSARGALRTQCRDGATDRTEGGSLTHRQSRCRGRLRGKDFEACLATSRRTPEAPVVLLVTGSNIAEPAKWSARKIFQNSETAFSRLSELNEIGGTKNAGVVGS